MMFFSLSHIYIYMYVCSIFPGRGEPCPLQEGVELCTQDQRFWERYKEELHFQRKSCKEVEGGACGHFERSKTAGKQGIKKKGVANERYGIAGIAGSFLFSFLQHGQKCVFPMFQKLSLTGQNGGPSLRTPHRHLFF